MVILGAEFAAALQLSEGTCNDEEVSACIVALLTSAVNDLKPKKTVSEILHLVVTSGAMSHLDPLNTIPMLLPYDDPAARELIAAMGECGLAKEVVMAAQEAVERLERLLHSDDDEGNDEEQLSETNEMTSSGTTPPKKSSILTQLTLLVDLYASAIPRLKLRRKSTVDTLRPLLQDLGAVLQLACHRGTIDEGRAIISSVGKLVEKAFDWVASVSEIDSEDGLTCKKLLHELLNKTILSYSRYIRASIAQRTFIECYPRFASRSSLESGWQFGDMAISEAIAAYHRLGINSLTEKSSVSGLVISAYSAVPEDKTDTLISQNLPMFISSIQANCLLEEVLSVLTKTLYTRQRLGAPEDLPPDISVPLCSVLPAVASIHPDAPTRYITFRVLSLLLSASVPQLSFQHLVELTRDSEFPQMRVSSVGLVKEMLLQAFSKAGQKNSLFLTPLFLRTFGPILFRPNPPDLFAPTDLTFSDFQENHEPERLVECLSLYYVLLQRDEGNLTGVRDEDVLKRTSAYHPNFITEHCPGKSRHCSF
ncbi:hypothetical protein B0H34DRAFT_483918 [Crassisporium funariophilum]|nr:hypothetical protein B0H34DRAFT_483918 [Crassisporium funariophilum]